MAHTRERMRTAPRVILILKRALRRGRHQGTLAQTMLIQKNLLVVIFYRSSKPLCIPWDFTSNKRTIEKLKKETGEVVREVFWELFWGINRKMCILLSSFEKNQWTIAQKSFNAAYFIWILFSFDTKHLIQTLFYRLLHLHEYHIRPPPELLTLTSHLFSQCLYLELTIQKFLKFLALLRKILLTSLLQYTFLNLVSFFTLQKFPPFLQSPFIFYSSLPIR